MNDSTESSAQGSARRWLLLIHQVPPRPDYLRVKVRRRLQRLGAVPLKNSVYVLPDTEENLEDFQWLANEIVADGGDATICAASMLFGASDAELTAVFDKTPVTSDAGTRALDRPRGATWVTRENVFIDRIASAWLIRRFIDESAKFRFAPARGYRPKSAELRFDMYQGEFTHVGDRCTFEMLLAHFALDDSALATIGEFVHDLDFKDEKFGRGESAGILAVIRGITVDTNDDAERIARAAPILDGLYTQLRRRR